MLGSGDKDDSAEKTPWGAESSTSGQGSQLCSTDAETQTLIDTGVQRALSERYDILGEIGRGGMGVVYRARDRETGSVLALKVLLPEIAARADLIERFKSELLLARKVTHKNVCRVYDLNRFGTVVAISMEYIEGESLRSLLARVEAVSVRHGMKILRQVLAGLGEAHGQGVVHRDLKPENILITRDGTVKVMDFGIARSLETAATQTGAVIGTPAYMSPEQAEGKPADARSDIYSLGLMMYEMFTGRPAFRAETPVAMVAKHVHETPPPPKEVDPDLPERISRAIEKCLAKDPKKRFHSVDKLAAALTEKPEAVTTPVPAAQELSLPIHLAYWQRTDSFLLALAAVAVLVFVLAFRSLHPARLMEITVTGQEAQQVAQGASNRLAWNAQAPEAALWAGTFGNREFYSLWEKGGAKAARFAYWDIPCWRGWRRSPSLHYGVSGKGNLLWVSKLEDSGKLQPGPSSSSSQEQRVRVASDAVRAAFGQDLSALEPSKTLPNGTPLPSGVVAWRVSKGQGYVHDWIIVRLSNEVPSDVELWVWAIESSPVADWVYKARFGGPGTVGYDLLYSALAKVFPAFYVDTAHGRSFVVIPLLVGLVVTLLVRKRVWQSWSCGSDKIFAVVLAALFTAGCLRELLSSIQEGPPPAVATLKVLYPLIYFVLALCMVYSVLATVFYYLVRRLPEKAVTYVELFRKGLRAESSGLALVRGAALGWVFIALCLLLAGLSQILHWVVPSIEWLGLTVPSQFREDGLPTALVISVMVMIKAFIAVWLLTALPLALFRGATRNRVVMFAACALVWCVAAFSLQSATFYSWLPFYVLVIVQAVAITATLIRFDLLTSFFAVVTVETWLLAWPGYITFHRIETLQYFLVPVVWSLALLWGIGLYFRPQLVTGWQRVVAVFE